MLAVVLAVNLALAIAKGGYGLATGSLGMIADGLHALLHALGSVVGLVGVALAARPPDPSHPYGYERYEPLAALGIVGLMLLALREILAQAWSRLVSGEIPAVTPLSFGIMGLSIGVGLVTSLWEQRQGQALGSQVLIADGTRGLSDGLVSLSVVGGLLAAVLGTPLVDLLVSIGIAAVIAWTARTILRQVSAVLTDAAVADLDRIAAAAASVQGVLGVHRVRARGAAGTVRVDLHITVDPNMSARQAHELTHRVMERVRGEVGGIVEVLVHVGVEPEPEHQAEE